MREELKVVRDVGDYLNKVIKPLLLRPQLLRVGRPGKHIGLRPREVLGLFLMSAVGSFLSKEQWAIASDPDNGDGVVYYLGNDPTRKEEGFAVEQVYIHKRENGSVTDLAIKKILDKSANGFQYTKNRNLIVFCDKKGTLDPQRIKKLVNNVTYDSIWLFGKYSRNNFEYIVFSLKTVVDPVAAFLVKIDSKDAVWRWSVETLGAI